MKKKWDNGYLQSAENSSGICLRQNLCKSFWFQHFQEVINVTDGLVMTHSADRSTLHNTTRCEPSVRNFNHFGGQTVALTNRTTCFRFSFENKD